MDLLPRVEEKMMNLSFKSQLNLEQRKYNFLSLSFYLIATLLLCSNRIMSQNMVKPISDCKVYEISNFQPWESLNTCENWTTINSYANICRCRDEEYNSKFYGSAEICDLVCEGNELHSLYFQLYFYSHVTEDPTLTYHNGAGASYVSYEFDEVLDYKSIYHLSYDIFIPNDAYNVSEISKRIGVKFSRNRVKRKLLNLTDDYYFLIPPYLSFGDVERGKWNTINMSVKLSCDSKFMTFGVFPELGWPDYYSEPKMSYYISNVKLKKKDYISTDSIITQDCIIAGEDDDIYNSNSLSVYYNTNQIEPLEIDTLVLDSIVSYARINQRLIEIISFADDIGSRNLELSIDRSKRIKELIVEKYNYSDELILAIGKGSIGLDTNNLSDENQRKYNRRSEISISEIKTSQIFYELALSAINHRDYNTARANLIKWFYVVPTWKRIFALFDSRLDPLNQDKNFKKLVKNDYLELTKHAFYLDSLSIEDQWYRTMANNLRSLTTYDSTGVYYGVDKMFSVEDPAFIKTHDNSVLNQITNYIDKYDYPSIDDVGGRANRAPFYALVHSNDTLIIAKYLPYLEQSCRMGESNWINYATLYDRLQVEKNKVQRYCTQYEIKGKEVSYAPYEGSIEDVNKNRWLLGLGPISENVGFKLK